MVDLDRRIDKLDEIQRLRLLLYWGGSSADDFALTNQQN
jgi:hypothetical protein